jgi:nitroimidazol reductase NimA-like FMN-containing flavoprotein (pyridoxamine 5'-phosphate oxidase superfamily)
MALSIRPMLSYPAAMDAAPTERSRVRRAPARAAYDRDTIDAILDEALVAHLGFAIDGHPYVIPTLHARVGDTVYVHGSAASRAIRALGAGAPACLTVTLLDGIVFARSAFHHSINYRSVVVLGEARPVANQTERAAALELFTERLAPGRWSEVRPPERAGAQEHACAGDAPRRNLGEGPQRTARRRRRGLRARRLGRHGPARDDGRHAGRRSPPRPRNRAVAVRPVLGTDALGRA